MNTDCRANIKDQLTVALCFGLLSDDLCVPTVLQMLKKKTFNSL